MNLRIFLCTLIAIFISCNARAQETRQCELEVCQKPAEISLEECTSTVLFLEFRDEECIQLKRTEQSLLETQYELCELRTSSEFNECVALQSLKDKVDPSGSLLENGKICASSSQCQSGFCFSGPDTPSHSNINYCVARDLTCALPGADGAAASSVPTVIDGVDMICDPSAGRFVAVAPEVEFPTDAATKIDWSEICEQTISHTRDLWECIARNELGVREVVGPGNSQRIMDYAKFAGIPYKSDDIVWSGLFVAWVVGQANDQEPLPANPLGSRQWLTFGVPAEVPQVGDIMVFWRQSPSSWKGHVAFYVGEDETAFHVIGGNQSNEVNIARISKERLLAIRTVEN